MTKVILAALAGVCILAALGGCPSSGRPHGPLDSISFQAGANKGLASKVVGTVNEQANPREIIVTLPPGTDTHSLVAMLSLHKEAVITVVSGGTRVVQENGVTPNDFALPLTYAIEVPGDKKPWAYKVLIRQAQIFAATGLRIMSERGSAQEANRPAK
jgi:hypothetical protein